MNQKKKSNKFSIIAGIICLVLSILILVATVLSINTSVAYYNEVNNFSEGIVLFLIFADIGIACFLKKKHQAVMIVSAVNIVVLFILMLLKNFDEAIGIYFILQFIAIIGIMILGMKEHPLTKKTWFVPCLLAFLLTIVFVGISAIKDPIEAILALAIVLLPNYLELLFIGLWNKKNYEGINKVTDGDDNNNSVYKDIPVVEKYQMLINLKNEGLISEEEFAEKKKALLG